MVPHLRPTDPQAVLHALVLQRRSLHPNRHEFQDIDDGFVQGPSGARAVPLGDPFKGESDRNMTEEIIRWTPSMCEKKQG